MAKFDFEKEFNRMIVDTFHNILKTELKMINNITRAGLSMREVHLLELVSDGESSVGRIAKSFEIAPSSVTMMVKKLVAGGYLVRIRSQKDARNVHLQLTEKGETINDEHENFHRNMIAKISKKMSRREKKVLAQGVSALNEMFKNEFLSPSEA